MRLLALILATAGGAGLLPVAPGTWGSAVAALACWAWVAAGGGVAGFAVATLAATLVGVWAADATERAWGQSDDGRIVIDEVAGQWWTLLPVVAAAPDVAFFPSLVTGFVLFRGLDIAKPGPVRWAERRFRGGLGVMADDVVAGWIGAAVMLGGLWWLGRGA